MARASLKTLADRWAQEIVETRGLLNMTQKEFAAHAGVNFRTLSQWETGAHLPHPRARHLLRKVIDKAHASERSSVATLEERVALLEAQVRVLTLATASEAA